MERVVCKVVSFILSFMLFLVSFTVIFRSAVLGPSCVVSGVGADGCFISGHSRVGRDLIGLNCTSKLSRGFFRGIISRIAVRSGARTCLGDFCTNSRTGVSAATFGRGFGDRLSDCVDGGGLGITGSKDERCLVGRTTGVCTTTLEVPLFTALSICLVTLGGVVPLVINNLTILITVLYMVVVFAGD